MKIPNVRTSSFGHLNPNGFSSLLHRGPGLLPYFDKIAPTKIIAMLCNGAIMYYTCISRFPLNGRVSFPDAILKQVHMASIHICRK